MFGVLPRLGGLTHDAAGLRHARPAFLVAAALAAVVAVGAHPAVAGRAGRWAASVARHVRPGINPAQVAETSRRLATLARPAMTGRVFLASFGFASGDLLFDLLTLDLAFLALRYQPGAAGGLTAFRE